MLTEAGKCLPGIARTAIVDALGTADRATAGTMAEAAPWCLEEGACFVTLKRGGHLRGCIGTLEAYRPLLVDVQYNAVSAALHDSRFLSVTPGELVDITIEVSVLSSPEPLSFENQPEALAQLRPGRDGIVFEYRSFRSTFLPQVWEDLPQPEQFLAMLKQKAGLPADFWAEGIRLSRYGVTKWHEAVEER
ncbi:AmmeMemoRadiSam system protein A [Nitrosomonas sp. ANs5]|uniref:AmmeMemoRadiSam system protein A n=1 Tax=Nitrosomonas sp. ANs5 TaxID=3423941 RepID=UPI003D32E335